MNRLAIVIPAYKPDFFDEALASIAKQTNKNFTVYIGDDSSPFDLKPIIDKYRDVLTIGYTKFTNNIGSKYLVEQWNRCVELTQNEEWIWLFSDDDVADENAVEQFYLILEKTKSRFDVYRFNTITIDGSGKVISINPMGPNEESSEEMAYNLLLGKRGNSMPDHIFSKKVFVQNNGFVHTLYAQGADWASSILFAKDKGICIIPNAILYWRYSGKNISSIAFKNTSQMVSGYLQFIRWILLYFKNLTNASSGVSYELMREAAYFNLKSVITNHYRKLSIKNSFKVFLLLEKEFKYGFKQSLKRLFSIKEGVSPWYYKIRKAVNFLKRVSIISNKLS